MLMSLVVIATVAIYGFARYSARLMNTLPDSNDGFGLDFDAAAACESLGADAVPGIPDHSASTASQAQTNYERIANSIA